MAVIMLDVDEFRQINELYDREFGNWVLKTLGQFIQAILPDNACLFRLEKDKMGILMTNVQEADVKEFYKSLQEHLRKIRECVKQGHQGFFLNYQPQIQPQTGEMKGVEVLVRWKNQRGNMVSPGEFIPIMEEHGLIYSAGLWILRTAFQEAKEWIKKKPDFTISVNVSALQFFEETFLEDLYQTIEEENFPCENLVIELTESFAIKNIEILQKKFNDMRKRKIRIALDDFGSGYCSLASLKNTPVDIVKLDRTFVKDILNNKFDAAFINLVTEICHIVSIDVCLEGVEEKEEYEFVKKIPLDSIQGYYFGKPMDKEAIDKKL